jgi:hypothetical protein
MMRKQRRETKGGCVGLVCLRVTQNMLQLAYIVQVTPMQGLNRCQPNGTLAGWARRGCPRCCASATCISKQSKMDEPWTRGKTHDASTRCLPAAAGPCLRPGTCRIRVPNLRG